MEVLDVTPNLHINKLIILTLMEEEECLLCCGQHIVHQDTNGHLPGEMQQVICGMKRYTGSFMEEVG